MELPGKTAVWPGHDYGTGPTSTIANEKETNPFLEDPVIRSSAAATLGRISSKQKFSSSPY